VPVSRTAGLPGLLVALIAAASIVSSCHKAPPESEGPPGAVPSIALVSFACDEGLMERIEKWSGSGRARGCYKDAERHGRWLFWEEGYVNLEGFYRDGVKHGAWTVFNGDGSVFAEILFDNGTKTEKHVY